MVGGCQWFNGIGLVRGDCYWGKFSYIKLKKVHIWAVSILCLIIYKIHWYL